MRNHKPVLSRVSSLGWLSRCVAAFMLTVLLPATVLAMPFRYCVGQDGHRAIEFVHAKVYPPANSKTLRGASWESMLRDPHVLDPYCQDRLLLPVIAKSASCAAPRPSSDPVVSNDFRFDLRTRYRWRSHPALRLALLQRPQPDSRLVTLRTVVLLN